MTQQDGRHMQLFCDIPRNSQSPEAVQTYFEAGFNCWVMTEDDASLTGKDGKLSKEYKQNIEHVSKYGEVYIRNHYNYPHYWVNHKEVDIERWGKIVTIPERSITTDFIQAGNVTGFYQTDEPSYDGIDEMLPLVEWHNRYAGSRLFHVNLFPSYGDFKFAGHTFEEYVEHYIDTVLDKVLTLKTLGIDNYPLLNKEGKNYLRDTYLSDLFTIARYAKAYNEKIEKSSEVILGYCVQAFRDVALRDITCREDISFQVNTCLAMGARYLEYYLYCPIDEQVGLLDEEGNTRPNYAYVKSVNEELRKWEQIYLSFSWYGLKTINGIVDHTNENAFEQVKPYEEKNLPLVKDVQSSQDTVIGTFKDGEGRMGYMTVNYTEPTEGRTDEVIYTFDDGIERVVVYQDGEGKKMELSEHRLCISLASGESAFIIVCGEERSEK